MNSNLKKLFGFATIAACTFGFAMNVNAAAAVTGTTCTATDMDELKECLSGKGNYADIDTLDMSGVTNISEPVTIKDMTVTAGALTVDSGKTLTLTNSPLSATSLTVEYKGVVNATNSAITATGEVKVLADAKVTASITKADATHAIKAGTISVAKGATLTAAANNKNSNVADSKNTANAIEATTLTANGSTVTVTAGILKAAVEASEATINALDVTGNVEADKTSKVKADKIDGNVTANDKSSVVAKEISGTADATKENASIKADKIEGAVTVNGKGASVEYADSAAAVTVTEGVAKKNAKDDNGKPYVEVKVAKVDSISLAANERLVIADVADLNEGFKITAVNGAIIENNTTSDLTLNVNGQEVTVEKYVAADDNAYVVGNGTDAPVDPTDPVDPGKPEDPNKPNTGDDQPSKNPQTFDGILSYVGVALSSVGGLGVSLKKRLFR